MQVILLVDEYYVPIIEVAAEFGSVPANTGPGRHERPFGRQVPLAFQGLRDAGPWPRGTPQVPRAFLLARGPRRRPLGLLLSLFC